MNNIQRIKTIGFKDNMISETAELLLSCCGSFNFSGTAVVFGGKRPALYLNKELSKKLNSSFIPPAVFSMDEFAAHIAGQNGFVRLISELDAGILMHGIASRAAPGMLKDRSSVARFLPWAQEIVSFIDELDIEDVREQRLSEIENLAGIGFDVPDSVNELLKKIGLIRRIYHESLAGKSLFSRGMVYNKAAGMLRDGCDPGFDRVIFCGLYYLHRTEKSIVSAIDKTGKAHFIIQKDDQEYPALTELEDMLGVKLDAPGGGVEMGNIEILRGSDTHTQVAQAGEILKEVQNPEECVVVIPDSSALIPLLYGIPENINSFNVSAGYPFARSSIYGLLNLILEAQSTRKTGLYYSRSYLKVLLHPLLKNAVYKDDPNIGRIFVHKIEEALLGMEKSSLERSLFISLEDVEKNSGIIGLGVKTAESLGARINDADAAAIIKNLHDEAFRNWEDIDSLLMCAGSLSKLLESILQKSKSHNYPFSIKSYEALFNIVEEIESSDYKDLRMPPEDIYKIFSQKLEGIVLSFSGSPLKGLQVLGLYETRALSFKKAVVVDLNESKIPHLKVAEVFMPRQIMIGLGLNRIEREEEIQRYHFRRLLGSAEESYLIYNDSLDAERSRFLEELIWENEKKLNTADDPSSKKRVFRAESRSRPVTIEKSQKVADFLSGYVFSPSSIDVYLNCPLSFYYRYVLGLEEKAELLEEPEAKEIGGFLHELLEKSFKPLLDRDFAISPDFEAGFESLFGRLFEEKLKPRLSSEYFLTEDVLRYRLKRFVENEKQRGVKSVIGLETDSFSRKIMLAGRDVNFTARIDRIDELVSGAVLIVDYKTGSMPESPAGIERLSAMSFDRKSMKEAIRSFQLPIYYYLVKDSYPGRELNACLYSLKDLEIRYFIKQKEYSSAGDIEKICLNALGALISEILDKNMPFRQDADEDSCRYCPYKGMCK